ncbi:DUF1707 SHOCT-like domain-containing protein [Streptacidiphilus rugosus]|uniref:DUF1707 SHOCT-like domain-containing protein n=1 Tax=Streptacidiphilus rugosus TaxID=405783 RepID=UPI00068F76BB|nr:DUF1707 domain-containing protein [Streptacidiphilus rugosus]
MSLPQPYEPDRNRPEARASHEDRDRVAEVLRVAAGDGRLTLEELDQRLELCLSARTFADLEPLVADLPVSALDAVAPAAQAKDLVQFRSRGSTKRFEGVWVVPRRMELTLHGGAVVLDFTRAITASGPVTELAVELHGSSIRIIAPPGYLIDADDMDLRGSAVADRRRAGAPNPAAVTHRIVLTGVAKGSSVSVRDPRAPREPGRLRRFFGGRR